MEKRVRKDELYRSCQELGINQNYVSLLDSSIFPDNIKTFWPVIDVAAEIENHIFRNGIDYG